jgi:hypothetical protein
MTSLFRLTLATRPIESGLLGADNRVVFGFGVDLEPGHKFFGYGHIREDSLDRAFRKACIAVYAGIGVDKKLVRQLVKRLNGAHGGAIGVLTFNTRFGNDIRHLRRKTPFCGVKIKLKP